MSTTKVLKSNNIPKHPNNNHERLIKKENYDNNNICRHRHSYHRHANNNNSFSKLTLSHEINQSKINLQKLDKQFNACKSDVIKKSRECSNISPFSRKGSLFDEEMPLEIKNLANNSNNNINQEDRQFIKKLIFDKDNDNDNNNNIIIFSTSRRYSRAPTERLNSTRPQTHISTARESCTRLSTHRKINNVNNNNNETKYIDLSRKGSEKSIITTITRDKSQDALCKKSISKPELQPSEEADNFLKRIELFKSNEHDITAHRPDDKETFLQYEKEILGPYRNKAITKHTPEEIANNIMHIQKLKVCLNNESKAKRKYLIDLIKNRNLLKKYLRTKDKNLMIEEFNKLITIAIKFDDVYLLLETFSIIGDTHILVQDFQKAIAAYNQLRIGSELSGNILKKIESFIGLAECCRYLSFFSQGIMFLRRALQYAWYIDDTTIQYNICDKIGMIYYHLGDLESAKFYHRKYFEAPLFNKDLELIKFSNEEVANYMKKYHLADLNITPLYFERLSLPKLELLDDFQVHLGEITDYTTRKHFILPSSPSICTKKGYSPGDTFYERIDAVFDCIQPTPNFFTEMPAHTQIERILKGEPEFENKIGSPRIAMRNNGLEEFSKPTMIKKKVTSTDRLMQHKRRVMLKKGQEEDRSTYSLSQALADNNMVHKDLKLRLKVRFDSNSHNNPESFDEIKKMLRIHSQYIPQPPVVLLNHQVIDKSNHLFLKNIQINNKRIHNFYKNILDNATGIEPDVLEANTEWIK